MARRPRSGEEGGGGWWPDGAPDDDGRDREPDRPGSRDDGDKRRDPARPPRGLKSRGTPKQVSRYSMFVGIAFFAITVIALLNLLRSNNDSGIAGVNSSTAPLPEFAVPDAKGTSDADANVYQDDCESSSNPCPEGDQRTSACDVEATAAIRICDLFDKPLAISFWFTRGGDCTPTQDNFDAVAQRYRSRVNFLSVNIRDDRDTVLGIARGSGWQVPLGLDPDGAVSNLYRVGGCPTIYLAYPGGIPDKVELGSLSEAELADSIDGLIAASRQRASASR